MQASVNDRLLNCKSVDGVLYFFMDKEALDHPFKRSSCPITNMLELFGDRWSLLVVRDIHLGKSTYSEFLASPEQISTNILANRLKQLEASGIIAKIAYQNNPVRYQYELTEKGKDLLPVIRAMLDWAEKYMPDCQVFSRKE